MHKEVGHQNCNPHNNVGEVLLHVYVYNISSLLLVKGQLEGQMVEYLLDSRKVVFVVCFSALSDSAKDRFRCSNVQVMGANGLPLNA